MKKFIKSLMFIGIVIVALVAVVRIINELFNSTSKRNY